jgi:hypothetical protein
MAALTNILQPDPSISYRGALAPYLKRTVTDPIDDVSEYEQREFAMPSLAYDPLKFLVNMGKMIRGERPVDPKEITKGALDVGMLSAPVGLLGGVPKGAVLGMFAGSSAKTANKEALKTAQEMAKEGASRDKIWNETGWFKDVDGNWKFEIDDSQARLRPDSYFKRDADKSSMKTQNVLKHDALYDAYPNQKKVYPFIYNPEQGLGEMKTIIQEPPSFGPFATAGGAYDLLDDAIYNYRPRQTRPDEMKSTQLHELQHAIQRRENFASGGNEQGFGQMLDSIKNSAEYKQEISNSNIIWKENFEPKMKKLESKQKDLVENRNFGKELDLVFKEMDKLYVDFDNLKKTTAPLSTEIQRLSPAQYVNKAGEVEARNVQTRMDFTPQQRKETPPWETLDTPEERIVKLKMFDLD